MPHLFTYGTLRPGNPNHWHLLAASDSGRTAYADNLQLRDNHGAFPYAEPAAHGHIVGTLIHLTDREWDVIRPGVDQLEGYMPAREDLSHYLRTRWLVRYLDKGRWHHVTAWTYLAAPSIHLDDLPIIPTGDWNDVAALTKA